MNARNNLYTIAGLWLALCLPFGISFLELDNSETHLSQISNVMDPPIISCPADMVIFLGPGECSAFISYQISAFTLAGDTAALLQTDTSGLTSGDAFPIGLTVQMWIAIHETDTTTCSFTIQVNEYNGPVLMACNDTINVSADQHCEVFIFADMVLEGNLYACYDDYIISIENVGTDTGLVAFSAMGLTGGFYSVTVTDPDSDIWCSGVIHLEDKIPPQIVCACPPDGDGADTCEISCLAVDLLLAGNIPPQLYPEIIDNCGHTLEVSNIQLNDLGCGEGTVIVSWLVTDNSGFTATCDQEFQINPLSTDSISFPPNFVGPCGSSNHPDVTGWPQIGGFNLTDQAGLCNLFLGYWDKELDDCGGGRKILRTWTVLDWCTLELLESYQVIKLSDEQGPLLTCPPNLTVGTDFWYCYANVSIPRPVALDECSAVGSFSLVSSSGTIVQSGNNYIVQGLLLGTHVMIWTVTDICGNRATCSFTVTVIDDVVPVANCDHHTVVSLTTDGPKGITLVPASVFDDGSYDNCGPVTFRARRMTSCIDIDWTTNGGCLDDIPNGFIDASDLGTTHKPCVPFGCCDVPRSGSRMPNIMVELEITDQAGNKNYCMVEVEVQDKIGATMICPPDIYVSCDFWFHAEEGIFRDLFGNRNGNLDEDPLSTVFGNMYDAIVYNDDQSVRQPIIIFDPGNTQYPQPYHWGLDGWADDNCKADLEVRVRIFDDCTGDALPGNPPPGAIRLIERRFTVRDNQQGFSPSVCTQHIWVVDFQPFYISDNNCNNPDPNDGVRWPCDILITTCPDDLTNTGQPQIFSDACSLIGVTFEDTRFDFSDGACYKILREWNVIDWCQYNPVTGYGLWTYTQIIKVLDHQPPVFLECPQGPLVLCVENEGVRLPASNQAFLGENDPNASSCSVHVTLKHRIRETCDGQVAFDVKFYPNNGTQFIPVLTRTIITLGADHEVDLVFNSEESSIQSIRRNGLPYNIPGCGDYHKLLWSVEDGCGNWSHCEYLIRLEDCKQPSPVCIQGLSTVVMPSNCEVTLWAKDFNASSFDDCTPASNLLYSFEEASYEPSKTFNVTNIPAYGVELSIPIWVADGGTDDNCNGSVTWNERNKDNCTTTILFTDNSGNCDLSGSIVYEGEILTYYDEPVEAVKVSLVNNLETVYSMQTADNGKYIVAVPEIDSLRYSIKPQRQDQPRNGVSTLDLVRIQKHLLGKEPFISPYQYIAADANNNSQVSAIDLVEIRKLILGIYPQFPNNDSWRFVKKNYTIHDPQHPWPLEEKIDMLYNGQSYSGLDFIGIKIGDVNNSVQANTAQILPRNTKQTMLLEVESPASAKPGEIIHLRLTFPERVAGFQWTIETKGLEFISVTSEDISIHSDHAAVLNDEWITMSWNDEDFFNSDPLGQMSVDVQFLAREAGKVTDMFWLTDRITPTEAYRFNDEVVFIQLNIPKQREEMDFALFQNEPNPWADMTTIAFDLPEAGWVKLTLFDPSGKVVRVYENQFASGHHSMPIMKQEMTASGMLYYRLEANHYSATKKMIRLE